MGKANRKVCKKKKKKIGVGKSRRLYSFQLLSFRQFWLLIYIQIHFIILLENITDIQLNFCLFGFTNHYILSFYSLSFWSCWTFAFAFINLYVVFSIIFHYYIVTSYLCSTVCISAFLESVFWLFQSTEHNIFSCCFYILRSLSLNYSSSDVFRNNYLIQKVACLVRLSDWFWVLSLSSSKYLCASMVKIATFYKG